MQCNSLKNKSMLNFEFPEYIDGNSRKLFFNNTVWLHRLSNEVLQDLPLRITFFQNQPPPPRLPITSNESDFGAFYRVLNNCLEFVVDEM